MAMELKVLERHRELEVTELESRRYVEEGCQSFRPSASYLDLKGWSVDLVRKVHLASVVPQIDVADTCSMLG